MVSWKTLMSYGGVKGGEEISGIRWVWAQGDGWKESSVTCQNDQQISEVSEEWLSCFFG